jgi:hypothetical protein
MKPLKNLVKITPVFLKKRTLNIILVLFAPLAFLIIGTLTLRDYGFNWDEPYHFMRGQAYLHFFLTGEKDYSSLVAYPRLSDACPEWAEGFCHISPGGATDTLHSNVNEFTYGEATDILQSDRKVKRSFYQHDIYPLEDILKLEDGHPPTGGLFAALTNYVFYQKLGIMGDLESHHFFEVFSAFLIVLGVAIFVYKELGVFASFVSSFSLAVYPLFFSESHFNIKDPLLTAFFGLTIILFYSGIKKRKVLFIFLSAIFLGLATGVKFNTFFLPFIIGPWLMFYLAKEFFRSKTKKVKVDSIRKNILIGIAVFLVPLIAFLVFYSLWPFLWKDTWVNLNEIFGYYKQIGLGTPAEMAPYIKNGWNTYPIIWIVYTTPIPILVLSVIGIIRSIYKLLNGDDFSLLILLWFFVPILRVSWPNTVIYGGIRHIMEYVPPMAVLAGIGAFSFSNLAKKALKDKAIVSISAKIIIISSLIFVVFEMVNIHPNENVYFNQLIGGLSGARDKNIPSWGNTYGNVYLQGVKWLNENAESNAKLGLAISTMGNVPKLSLRADIDFYSGCWSGTRRDGEYEIEMDFDWWPKRWYSFQYLDVFLEPVYVAEVDGVPLLKIWKNDLEHTKEGFEREKIYLVKTIDYSQKKVLIDMGREILLTGLKIEHSSWNCEPVKAGYIALSLDNIEWERVLEPLAPQVPPVEDIINENTFVFLFPAKKVRYILVDPLSTNSCLAKTSWMEIKGLERLP